MFYRDGSIVIINEKDMKSALQYSQTAGYVTTALSCDLSVSLVVTFLARVHVYGLCMICVLAMVMMIIGLLIEWSLFILPVLIFAS